MYVQYGSYQFASNTVVVQFTQRRNYTDRNAVQSITKRLTLDGVLLPSTATQAQIKSDVGGLEDAFSKNGKDLGLYHDDGTKSHHFLDSSASLSGTKVISVDYPRGDGTEYATQRRFRIVVEAEFPQAGDLLLNWSETVNFQGDTGPRWVSIELQNGPPQFQTVAQRTSQIVTQSGNALGLYSYPSIPSPLFGGIEHGERRRRQFGSPTNNGVQFVNWPVSWSYTFESTKALFALPNAQ